MTQLAPNPNPVWNNQAQTSFDVSIWLPEYGAVRHTVNMGDPDFPDGKLVSWSAIAPWTPPVLTAAQLARLAQQKAMLIEAGGIAVNIAAANAAPQWVECATDPMTYSRLSGAAATANADPNASIHWAFPTAGGSGVPNVVNLSAAQILTIKAAVDAFYVSVQAALGAVIAAITADPPTITTPQQIASYPWPANS